MAAETLNATFIRSKVVSDDGQWRVSIFAGDDGREFKGVGPPPRVTFVCGVVYRLTGDWGHHVTHGKQFDYVSAVEKVDVTRDGMIAYLSRLPGIGPGRAGKLWDAYGDRAAHVLREDPSLASGVAGIPPEIAIRASLDLKEDSGKERIAQELYSLLAKRGFQVKKVVDVVARMWGEGAAAIIRRNPYSLLLQGVPSCGWKRTDALYLALGHRPGALKRLALLAVGYIVGWVGNAGGEGHTWHDAETVRGVIVGLVPASQRTPGDEIRAIRLAVRARMLTLRREGDKRFLALTDLAGHEEHIAICVARYAD